MLTSQLKLLIIITITQINDILFIMKYTYIIRSYQLNQFPILFMYIYINQEMTKHIYISIA